MKKGCGLPPAMSGGRDGVHPVCRVHRLALIRPRVSGEVRRLIEVRAQVGCPWSNRRRDDLCGCWCGSRRRRYAAEEQTCQDEHAHHLVKTLQVVEMVRRGG